MATPVPILRQLFEHLASNQGAHFVEIMETLGKGEVRRAFSALDRLGANDEALSTILRNISREDHLDMPVVWREFVNDFPEAVARREYQYANDVIEKIIAIDARVLGQNADDFLRATKNWVETNHRVIEANIRRANLAAETGTQGTPDGTFRRFVFREQGVDNAAIAKELGIKPEELTAITKELNLSDANELKRLVENYGPEELAKFRKIKGRLTSSTGSESESFASILKKYGAENADFFDGLAHKFGYNLDEMQKTLSLFDNNTRMFREVMDKMVDQNQFQKLLVLFGDNTTALHEAMQYTKSATHLGYVLERFGNNADELLTTLRNVGGYYRKDDVITALSDLLVHHLDDATSLTKWLPQFGNDLYQFTTVVRHFNSSAELDSFLSAFTKGGMLNREGMETFVNTYAEGSYAHAARFLRSKGVTDPAGMEKLQQELLEAKQLVDDFNAFFATGFRQDGANALPCKSAEEILSSAQVAKETAADHWYIMFHVRMRGSNAMRTGSGMQTDANTAVKVLRDDLGQSDNVFEQEMFKHMGDSDEETLQIISRCDHGDHKETLLKKQKVDAIFHGEPAPSAASHGAALPRAGSTDPATVASVSIKPRKALNPNDPHQWLDEIEKKLNAYKKLFPGDTEQIDATLRFIDEFRHGMNDPYYILKLKELPGNNIREKTENLHKLVPYMYDIFTDPKLSAQGGLSNLKPLTEIETFVRGYYPFDSCTGYTPIQYA
ncbi:MAG: hypothetical protein KDD76_05205, partial [Rickettsiales bacterium]|nr:hypothetical protein [Rickettsiales bacterium]